MSLHQDQQTSLAEDEMPQQWRPFLITYSQADMSLLKGCESFAQAVVKAFSSGHVVEWACCKEFHEDRGENFHMSIKFSLSRLWGGKEKAFAWLCFFKLWK